MILNMKMILCIILDFTERATGFIRPTAYSCLWGNDYLRVPYWLKFILKILEARLLDSL